MPQCCSACSVERVTQIQTSTWENWINLLGHAGRMPPSDHAAKNELLGNDPRNLRNGAVILKNELLSLKVNFWAWTIRKSFFLYLYCFPSAVWTRFLLCFGHPIFGECLDGLDLERELTSNTPMKSVCSRRPSFARGRRYSADIRN